MSDEMLLICGARLKFDDKSGPLFCRQNKQQKEMTVRTVIIRMDSEQCYIFVMFT